MNPRIIKLATGEALYANSDLIKFAKQTINSASDAIKEEDNIFFFNNVDYRRSDLQVAASKFQRVIKIEKANVCIVDENMEFPTLNPLSLKDNVINSNCPPELADDVIYNISYRGAEYVRTMRMFLDLFKLTNKPRIAKRSDLIKYVNSGFVLNEETYTSFIEMHRADKNVAVGILNNCDIESSLKYILYFFYFEYNTNTKNYMVNDYKNIISYLNQKLYGMRLNEEQKKFMFEDEYLINRFMSKAYNKINSNISSLLAEFKDVITISDINLKFNVEQL